MIVLYIHVSNLHEGAFIVCKGFKGIDEELKQALLSFTGEEWPTAQDGQLLALVHKDHIPDAFMQSMVSGAEYFARLQGAVIKRNLRLFLDFPQQEGALIHQARQLIIREFQRRYQIHRIAEDQRIVKDKWLSGDAKGNRVGGPRAGGKRNETGNLEERQAKKARSALVMIFCVRRVHTHRSAPTIVY